MVDSKIIDCISPNTGRIFADWGTEPISITLRDVERFNQNSMVSLMDFSVRRSVLLKIAEAIQNARTKLASIIVDEAGKTFDEADAEVDYACTFLTYAADLIADTRFENKIEVNRTVYSVSIGLGLLITPFNDPLAGITRKLANCIAAGGGALIKPSELGMTTALALENILNHWELGRYIKFLKISDHSLTLDLIKLKEVGIISFTGSTDVGRILSKQAGYYLKPFVGELGGTNPFVIFSDADQSLAVNDLVQRKIKAAGQACSAQNVVFIEKTVADEVIDNILDTFRNVEATSSGVLNAVMGPVRTKNSVNRLIGISRKLESQGAKKLLGGVSQVGEKSAFLVQPTVYRSRIPDAFFKFEFFGPVLGIYVFDDREKLNSLLAENYQPLALYLYSKDLRFLEKYVKNLRYGSIGLNSTGIQGANVPTGGFAGSGFGREGGVWGLREFLTTKNVKYFS